MRLPFIRAALDAIAPARRTARMLVALLMAAVLAVPLAAQFRGGRRGGISRGGFATLDDFDGGFQFCRLAFRYAPNGDGAGWDVDYPRADENLSIRLSELSRTPVSMDGAGQPKPLLLRASQPEIYRCPFIMMTEPGGAYFDDEEVANLRGYLLKGGFLWADDFWGDWAWNVWENQLREILPSGAYPIVRVPLDHQIFHEMFTLSAVPQIPGIGYWDGADRTSERGAASAVPHALAINDDRGRIMVLMTHNTDFGDSYERESDDPDYFMRFSVPGYGFGINVIVYAMTH